jgi:hypothetical protein
MLRLLTGTFIASLLFPMGATAAAAPSKQQNAQHALKSAVNAMVQPPSNNPPGQARRPQDPDQGDDNASDTAIFKVCTKDTPAARRSAICPGPPVSPP